MFEHKETRKSHRTITYYPIKKKENKKNNVGFEDNRNIQIPKKVSYLKTLNGDNKTLQLGRKPGAQEVRNKVVAIGTGAVQSKMDWALNMSVLSKVLLHHAMRLNQQHVYTLMVGRGKHYEWDAKNEYIPKSHAIYVEAFEQSVDIAKFAHEITHAFDHARGSIGDLGKDKEGLWLKSEVRAMMVQCMENVFVHFKGGKKIGSYEELVKVAYNGVPDGSISKAFKAYETKYGVENKASDSQIKWIVASTIARFLFTLARLTLMYMFSRKSPKIEEKK